MPPSRHATPSTYTWVVPPEVRPLIDAPAWACDLLEKEDASIATAVMLPPDAPVMALTALAISPRMRMLILHGHAADPGRYPSRSEALFAVLQSLIGAGYDDATIAGIILDTSNAIGDKPRRLSHRWLAGEIARARAKFDGMVF